MLMFFLVLYSFGLVQNVDTIKLTIVRFTISIGGKYRREGIEKRDEEERGKREIEKKNRKEKGRDREKENENYENRKIEDKEIENKKTIKLYKQL